MRTVCSFPSNESPALAEVGGKGYNLIQLSRFMPVPAGLVLTTAFFEPWWQEIFLTEEWKAYKSANDRLLGKVTEQLKAHCMLLLFSDDQNDSLAEALQNFESNQLFAVRSSSPEEDLEGTSFAGGYETVLGVTRKNIQAAIRTCFASCLDIRIVTYKREHKFDIYQPKIAVVIQKQIASEISGVAFSLNPVTNDFDEAVINSNYGLGETVVSGDVTPDTFVVDKPFSRIISKHVGKKERTVWLTAGGGTKPESTAIEKREQQSMSDARALEVTRLVTAVEARNGKPMDIEWAYEDGKLYLLQARPVTAYQPLPPDLITMPGRERRLYIDLTRSVQGIERPLSEMGASIIKLLLCRASICAFGKDITDHIDRTIPYVTAGRVYANISNVLVTVPPEKLLSVVPHMDSLAARALENINLNAYKASDTSVRLLPLMAAKTNPGNAAQFLKARTTPEAYREEADAAVELFKQQLMFLKRTRTSLRKFAQQAFDLAAHLLVSKLMMMMVNGLKAKGRLEKLAGPGLKSEVEALTKALPGNVTVEMGLDLYAMAKLLPPDTTAQELSAKWKAGELPEFLIAWEAFMSKYGHRAPEEFDIATKRFREDSSFLIKQIISLSQLGDSDKNPQEIYRKSVKARGDAYHKLKEIFGRKNRMNEIRLESSYRVITSLFGARETPKFCIMLAIDAVRQRIADTAASLVEKGQLDENEHVWELTFEQLCAASEGANIDLKAAVAANRARRARLQLKTLPKIFDSRGRIIRPPAVATRDNEMAGMAISAGSATGTARVLHTPDEKPLKAGDILVARATDPGWTPLFATASAVVLEVGGMLQHGALVAREYGLPCVSGIDNVTERIKDGSEIEVDGTNGIVRIL